MAEPAAIGRVARGAAPPPLPVSLTCCPSVFCVKCAADVTGLPPAARFCSRCGSPLPKRFPEPIAHLDPPPATAFDPPQILLAYARALFNLGWRYETAVGSRRNLEEAARCYWKAARLGNAGARLRFERAPEGVDFADTLPPLATLYSPPQGSDHC